MLLAEDNPVNRLLATRLLTRRGHTVVPAVDGQHAVAEFQAGEFDLILMDVQMPTLDGLAATAKIRDLERQRHQSPTPIVALTAHAMKGDREQCLNAGMDDYLTKPIDPTQLFAIIDRLTRAEALAT